MAYFASSSFKPLTLTQAVRFVVLDASSSLPCTLSQSNSCRDTTILATIKHPRIMTVPGSDEAAWGHEHVIV